MGVPHDLHLDVARVGDVPLGEHRPVTERGGGLAPCGGHGPGQFCPVTDQPHTPAAPAERRLDQQGQPDPGHQLVEVRVAGDLAAGQHRDARLLHQILGAELGAHRGDHIRRRPDERETGGAHVRGERGVLGQEPVAGMDGVGAGGAGRRDDEVAAQIGSGGRRAGQPDGLVGQLDVRRPRVGVGVDGDRGQAERVRGPYDADGDLAAVGDQEPVHGPHIRKTPKPRRPATEPECTADSASPSTVRVSRGSMMPSS